MMRECKISVLKTQLHEDLIAAYGSCGLGICPLHRVGDVFYGSYAKPDGFCDEAWKAIYQYVFALSVADTGVQFEGWVGAPNVAICSCNDGLRTVIFKIERTENEWIPTEARPATSGGGVSMTHKCRITVLKRELYPELQAQFCSNPSAGRCDLFEDGQEFIVDQRGPDSFWKMMSGKFCSEAWDAISRYVYAALQGGSIMKGWMKDEKAMIACCNDGTRPVIFKLERIDEEEAALFSNQS